jgi:hypothetical protein
MTSEYEFSSSQNVIIQGAAKNVKFVGTATVILGVMSGLGILSGDVGALITGLFYVVVGVMTRNVGQSLQAIVDLEGNDISHMMEAMSSLSSVYAVFKWMLLIAIGFGLLVGVLAVTGILSPQELGVQ